MSDNVVKSILNYRFSKPQSFVHINERLDTDDLTMMQKCDIIARELDTLDKLCNFPVEKRDLRRAHFLVDLEDFDVFGPFRDADAADTYARDNRDYWNLKNTRIVRFDGLHLAAYIKGFANIAKLPNLLNG